MNFFCWCNFCCETIHVKLKVQINTCVKGIVYVFVKIDCSDSTDAYIFPCLFCSFRDLFAFKQFSKLHIFQSFSV